MQQQCQISVVIPVYNAEKYLKECVDSVLNQSIDDYEILLINDGSTDYSGDICDQYGRLYSCIKVIHQENQGVSFARNVGIKKATGRYIAFVDADDTIDKEYLEKLVADMKPEGLVACPIDNKRKVCKSEISKVQAQISAFSERGMKGFPVCKIFDRKLLIEHGIFFCKDIAICEDLLFLVEYLSICNGPIIWKEYCGYNYRMNPTSALNGRFEKNYFKPKHLSEYEALKRTRKFLLEDPRVLSAWKVRKVKAAVTCLRTMIAVNHDNVDLYNELRKEAKENWVLFVIPNPCAITSRVSVLLSAISPRLEFEVWKVLRRFN